MSRRLTSSPAPAPPLEDDNLLREILINLPPLPSSLLRASLVSTQWRRVISDPKFIRSFRSRHRNPPLLGFFCQNGFSNPSQPLFTPALDPLDCIPEVCFWLPLSRLELSLAFSFHGCHHGLALCLNRGRREVIVWDPVTGHQRCVAYPPGLRDHVFDAAVLCGAGNGCDHMKGDCHLNTFKLVLLTMNGGYTIASACLYEAKSGVWGNIISTTTTRSVNVRRSNVLVGNTLCWLFNDEDILEFDFKGHSLAVIAKPADACSTYNHHKYYQILRTEDGGLGLAMLTGLTIKIWGRKLNSQGVAVWVLQKSVLLHKRHTLVPSMDKIWPFLLGYVEDQDLILLGVENHVITAQLEWMQFKKLFDRLKINHYRIFEANDWTTYYPYTSFYAGGIGAGDDGPEMLDSM